jgi:hypothetical protein
MVEAEKERGEILNSPIAHREIGESFDVGPSECVNIVGDQTGNRKAEAACRGPEKGSTA